jgi:autotransporter-associated beta strand protein
LGTATLTTGDATNTTFSGIMSGNGGLAKPGVGSFTLSGANTYTGATTINAGTLQLSGGATIAGTSAVTLANVAGATLDLNGTNETIDSLAGGDALGGNMMLGTGTLTTGGNNTSTTYTGIVSGTGGLTKAGTGVFTLSGANTYTGATTINAGTPARTRCFRPSTGSSAH